MLNSESGVLLKSRRFSASDWTYGFGSDFSGAVYLVLPLDIALSIAGIPLAGEGTVSKWLEARVAEFGLERHFIADPTQERGHSVLSVKHGAIVYGAREVFSTAVKKHMVNHGWQRVEEEALYLTALSHGYALIEVQYGWDTRLPMENYYGRANIIAVCLQHTIQHVIRLHGLRVVRVVDNVLQTALLQTRRSRKYRPYKFAKEAPEVVLSNDEFLADNALLDSLGRAADKKSCVTKRYNGDDIFILSLR